MKLEDIKLDGLTPAELWELQNDVQNKRNKIEDEERQKREEKAEKAGKNFLKTNKFKLLKEVLAKKSGKVVEKVEVTATFDLEIVLTTYDESLAMDWSLENIKCDNKFFEPHIRGRLDEACGEILECSPFTKSINDACNGFDCLNGTAKAEVVNQLNT